MAQAIYALNSQPLSYILQSANNLRQHSLSGNLRDETWQMPQADKFLQTWVPIDLTPCTKVFKEDR